MWLTGLVFMQHMAVRELQKAQCHRSAVLGSRLGGRPELYTWRGGVNNGFGVDGVCGHVYRGAAEAEGYSGYRAIELWRVGVGWMCLSVAMWVWVGGCGVQADSRLADSLSLSVCLLGWQDTSPHRRTRRRRVEYQDADRFERGSEPERQGKPLSLPPRGPRRYPIGNWEGRGCCVCVCPSPTPPRRRAPGCTNSIVSRVEIREREVEMRRRVKLRGSK